MWSARLELQKKLTLTQIVIGDVSRTLKTQYLLEREESFGIKGTVSCGEGVGGWGVPKSG